MGSTRASKPSANLKHRNLVRSGSQKHYEHVSSAGQGGQDTDRLSQVMQPDNSARGLGRVSTNKIDFVPKVTNVVFSD